MFVGDAEKKEAHGRVNEVTKRLREKKDRISEINKEIKGIKAIKYENIQVKATK